MFWDKKEDKNKLPDLPVLNRPPTIERSLYEPKSSLKIDPDHEINEIDGSSDLEDLNNIEKHSLPSFPDSPIKKGFSQTAIKEAINPVQEEFPLPDEEFQIPSDKKFETIELSEGKPQKISSIQELSSHEIEPLKLGLPIKHKPSFVKPQEKEEIFVKIDKFRAAKRSLQEIRAKMEEVESLLKKIRETKLREEQELASWETDLNSIKAKIKDVTLNIFEKVE